MSGLSGRFLSMGELRPPSGLLTKGDGGMLDVRSPKPPELPFVLTYPLLLLLLLYESFKLKMWSSSELKDSLSFGELAFTLLLLLLFLFLLLLLLLFGKLTLPVLLVAFCLDTTGSIWWAFRRWYFNPFALLNFLWQT